MSLAARSTLTLLGALTLMVITNLKLSLIILVAVPLTLMPVLVFGRRVRALSSKSQDSIAHVGSQAGEILQSIKVVQSYNREDMEQRRFDTEVDVAFGIARARIRQRAILMAVAILVLLGGLTGMLWSGGQDVIAGRMTGGELGAFVFYAVMVGTAFATLSEVWGDLQRAAGAAERLLELMTIDSEVVDKGREQPGHQQPIKFDKVSFTYPPARIHPRSTRST